MPITANLRLLILGLAALMAASCDNPLEPDIVNCEEGFYFYETPSETINLCRVPNQFYVGLVTGYDEDVFNDFLRDNDLKYFESIRNSQFLIQSTGDREADDFYTRYGGPGNLSLGDSTFVRWVTPVYAVGNNQLAFHPDWFIVELRPTTTQVQLDDILARDNLELIETNLQPPEFGVAVTKDSPRSALDQANLFIEEGLASLSKPAFSFVIR